MTCTYRAVLIFTRSVKGTSSGIAKARIDLRCGRTADHEGPHHDLEHDERWEDRGKQLTHLLRQDTGED